MNNKTTYTYELLLKMNLFHTAKWRRNSLIYALLTGLLSIGLTIADFLLENFHTLYAGMFFLALSLVVIFALIKNRKSKLSEAVKKQIQENPNITTEYQFGEDYITVNQTSAKIECNTRIDYSYILEAKKMDDTSFYFVTRNNLFYVVEDQQGTHKYFSFLLEKIKEFAGK